MSIITLFTDFGTYDAYVGIMKGAILNINSSATIIDITHHIDPQDIVHAAYAIKSSYRYFPVGTVHIAVVDPGVGSDRSIIALRMDGHIFLAPDNGVLSLVMEKSNIEEAVCVNNAEYFLEPVSQTFHGRDIFAPVAAHISKGIDIKKTGTAVGKESIKRLDIIKPFITDGGDLAGIIVSIDRFGNLVTNIDSDILEKFTGTCAAEKLEIMIGDGRITGLSTCYEDVKPHNPLAVIGSSGFLEISLNRGSARRHYNAEKGDMVKVVKSLLISD